MTIDIVNVINVSVSATPSGIAPYSVNSLACFTDETPVVALTGAYAIYTNSADVLTQWGSASKTYKAAAAVFAQSPNILTGGGVFIVCPILSGEDLADAIVRLEELAYFGGCSYTHAVVKADVVASATYLQSKKKFIFVASSTSSDLTSGGLLYDLQAASLSSARLLYRTSGTELDAFKWGYAGLAMSTNFSAANTTQTMHLKQIAGVTPDAGITSTVLSTCQSVGADVYVSIAGRPGAYVSGANEFWDDVYNLAWFQGAIQVAGFNVLAQTGTKIPQTEQGVDLLKAAYRQVCEQAISNRFIQPGTWTGTDTFGDPQDFNRNIVERGYYIYSQPVSQQPAVDREARKAPVAQIAIKYAGAIHSASIIINVNK